MMNYNKFLVPVMAFSLLGVFACSTTEKKDETINKEMKIVDHHSYAQPEEAVITHLNWVANIDFETNTINASAEYDIKTSEASEKIILDINNLNISTIEDQSGNELAYTIGEEEPFLGSPLIIQISETTTKIKISYNTSPEAEALQWLFGKRQRKLA